MHSEGIMAGELKHGPLALVDKAMPVIMIVTRDPVYVKCMNALQQVTARDGRPILICEKDDAETASMGYKTLEIPHVVDCLQVLIEFVVIVVVDLFVFISVCCTRNFFYFVYRVF